MERTVNIKNLSVKIKKDDVITLSKSYFEPKGYKITKDLIGVHFKVKKNAFVRARVGFGDNWVNNNFKLYIEDYYPSILVRILVGGLILPWIYFYFKKRKFVKEIYNYLNSKQFIDDAIELKS